MIVLYVDFLFLSINLLIHFMLLSQLLRIEVWFDTKYTDTINHVSAQYGLVNVFIPRRSPQPPLKRGAYNPLLPPF